MLKRTPLKRSRKPLKRSPLKRGKPKRRIKKPRATTLEKKLWKLFSLYVRKRDNYTCATCGKHALGAGMHAGHFIRRGKKSLKFDPRNVHAQCVGCNKYRNGAEAQHAEYIINTYGKGEFERIMDLSRTLRRWYVKEFELLIGILQKDPERYEEVYYDLTK